jgi:hypothetical protein
MKKIHKFWSTGDWEGLFIDGDLVKQNHQGRVDVLSYLEEGMEIETVVSQRVNLPEGDYSYPTTIGEIIENEAYDYDGDG